MRNGIVIILIFYSIVGRSEDYFIEGSANQEINIENIKSIEIHCYCSDKVNIIKHHAQTLKLEIKGEESSVGYHGSQESPKAIPKQELQFKIERSKDKMILSSYEWTYIHHSFLINKLTVHAPDSIEVLWKKIDLEVLEGRGK